MNQSVINILNKHLTTYQEVVIRDSYRLRSLKFTPQLVIDIGAHVGCFAAAAIDRWPDCTVLSVEPSPINVESLRQLQSHLPRLTILQAALGRGTVRCRLWRDRVDSNNDIYWSDGCAEVRQESDDWIKQSEPTDVPCLTLPQIVATAIGQLPKDYAVKIDCEGAECTLYNDSDAFDILRNAGYVAAEIHLKGMRWDTITCDDPLDVVKQDSGHMLAGAERWTHSFSDTHTINICRGTRLWMFTATRKDLS